MRQPAMRAKASVRQTRSVGRRAFTLIEVLVVVAIIALLAAILMPSLAAARREARIAMCIANAKQIGTLIAEYQAESQYYVPLVYNYWSNLDGTGSAAERCWLSVALRRYRESTRNIIARGPQFDPLEPWTHATRTEYEVKYMPEWYACPFIRGKAPQAENPMLEYTPRVLELIYGGHWESYHTWLHNERTVNADGDRVDTNVGLVKPGTPLNNEVSPRFVSKYQTMTFTKGGKHRKWEVLGKERELTSAISPSAWAVVYCGQGEFTPWPDPATDGGRYRRANIDSHRRNGYGGTTILFADTHVEWGRGIDIGKP